MTFPAFRPLAAGAAATLVVWTAPGSAARAADRTDELIGRASAYVVDFINRFSNVVAEERYVQDARTVAVPPKGKGLVLAGGSVHRELASDYLLVRLPPDGSFNAFRDVFEVDGRAVRDREERLTRLFLEPSAASMDQARVIEREGTRYNLGDPERTLNNPLLAMALLQPHYQKRFSFSLRDRDPDVGPDVWIVEYKERVRPTLLRKRPDGDLVSAGRLWIDRATGRVMKTTLAVSDSDEITTTFGRDDGLGLDVPAEMKEQYWTRGTIVTGTATYSRFRQFSVSTEERLRQ